MDDANKHDRRTEFRLKIGVAEIEFIGDADFLKNEIMPAVNRIVSVAESAPKVSNIQEILNIGVQSSTNDKIYDASSKSATTTVSSLASQIKKHKAEQNQIKRFLVTADWLRLHGNLDLKTVDVSIALRENQQAKLTNPADCLNQNASKGHCEKTTKGFFITPEGLKYLGGDQ